VTPSGVDLKVVADRQEAVAAYLEQLRDLPISRDEFLADHRNVNSAESLIRRSLEALLDIARHLLAKGHGRATLEYREIAKLSHELGLLPDAELAGRFERMAGFRNRMTHFYREVTPQELFDPVSLHLDDIEAVARGLDEAAARLAAT